jgi:S1-C subfamily serine protease
MWSCVAIGSSKRCQCCIQSVQLTCYLVAGRKVKLSGVLSKGTGPEPPVIQATAPTAIGSAPIPDVQNATPVAAKVSNSTEQPKINQRSVSGISLGSLGIRVQTTDIAGAKVIEIISGSIAQRAGLNVGDVITAIDGKSVATPAELDAALSTQTLGKEFAWVTCLGRRLWAI